jgi:segregation and condensation protein B
LPTEEPNIDHALDLDSFQAPGDDGLSLDSISQAFAAMLSAGDDPYASLPDAGDSPLAAAIPDLSASNHSAPHDSDCALSPRTILEAMLFVGTADNAPLAGERIATLMRGVRSAEIDELVRDLNRQYRDEARPYTILDEDSGYRLVLRDQFGFVRQRLYGSPRTARLSPAAIEVLAVVAYNEPVTADQVAQMRGTTSGPVLSQLVRRELLRVERAAERPHAALYRVTPRFLQLFGLPTVRDLPRAREVE